MSLPLDVSWFIVCVYLFVSAYIYLYLSCVLYHIWYVHIHMYIHIQNLINALLYHPVLVA